MPLNNNLVTIQFHGNIFEGIKPIYNLAVKSVGESLNAINTLTQNKLFPKFLENDKKGIKYRVLINGRDFEYQEKPTLEKPESVLQTELAMKISNLKTIDIVPVIEGADSDIGAIIVGVLLLVVAAAIIWVPGLNALFASYAVPVAVGLLVGGIGLIAAGVINLLTAPPQFEDFRTISGGGKASYLFNGPTNVVGEGGPVAVGYGRLLVGSSVISASYEITDQSAKEKLTV